MAINGAFSAATLSMMAQSRSLKVIGGNIANINTGGYKESEVRFQTVLSETITGQSDLGGVRTKDIQNIARQGQILSSDREMDIAVSGRGFFVLNTDIAGTGDEYYTRDGSLNMQLVDPATSDGYLVNKTGHYVMGWGADVDGTFSTSSPLQSIRIDPALFTQTGETTTDVQLNLNLPAVSSPGDQHEYRMQVYDSAFEPQDVTLTFTRATASNTWDVTTSYQGPPTAQVDTLTLGGTVEAGDVFSATVEGTTVSYTALATDTTLDNIAAGLSAALNANPTVSSVVTAAAAGGQITLTAVTAGSPFTSTTSTADVNRRSMTLTGAVGAAEANDTYSAIINGNAVTYTVTGAEIDINEVRDALIAEINADGTVNGAVTATPGAATGEIIITSNTAGTGFSLATGAVNAGVDANTAALGAASIADQSLSATITTANDTGAITSAAQQLTFSGKGRITNTVPLSYAFTFDGGATATVGFDFLDSTQYAGNFTHLYTQKNGQGLANLRTIEFDKLGHVVGHFDDQTQRKLYKLALGTFINPDGLKRNDGNIFSATEDSGEVTHREAAFSGYGMFSPNSYEISNVNVSDQFTRMIMVQSNYNSSATVFRTVDEMMTTARDLKR